jgi:diguanylate cyclase (GGDEF)-like protein
MGGDEFCILLPDTDLPEAMVVAERLRSQLEGLKVRYRGETIDVKGSFGVSCSARCGWNWQRLLDESDSALYEAKRGPGKVVAAECKPSASTAAEQMVLPTVMSDRRRR